MGQVTANGIQIEAERLGSPDAPALLLVRGLGTQMIQWPETFVDALAREQVAGLAATASAVVAGRALDARAQLADGGIADAGTLRRVVTGHAATVVALRSRA